MHVRLLFTVALGALLSLSSVRTAGAEDPAYAAERRVQELRKERRTKEALAYLDLAVKEYPDSGNLRTLYCWIYLEDLKDPKRALEYAQRLRQRLPRHPGGYYWEARAYETLGEFGRCVASLDGYRPHGNDFVQSNLKATCYYKNGQLSEALGALPGEQELGETYRKYEGWTVWLRGQIARRKLFSGLRPKLVTQVTSASVRERALALAKLALLGVPEGAGLAEQAGSAGGGALKTVAQNLKKELLAEPRFHRELEPPSVSEKAKRVRLEEAFAEMCKELDEPSKPSAIPPIAGKYMTPEMLEMAKKYPAHAQPFVVQVDEAAGRYSFGVAWVAADGQVDTSFEAGRWYSISEVRGTALRQVNAGLRDRWGELTTTSWRPDNKDLLMESRAWIDGGDLFFVSDTVTPFRRVP